MSKAMHDLCKPMNKTEEAIKRFEEKFPEKTNFPVNYFIKDVKTFFSHELEFAEKRGKAYSGKNKREYYQKGFKDGYKKAEEEIKEELKKEKNL